MLPTRVAPTIHSPNLLRVQKDHMDTILKRSPYKHSDYDAPPLYKPHTINEIPYNRNSRDFHQIRKVGQDTAALRQTMNYRLLNRLNAGHFLDDKEEKVSKIDEFLRQTMTNRISKPISSTAISDNAYCKSFNDKTYEPFSETIKKKYPSTSHTIQDPYFEEDNVQQCQKLSDKISKNRLMIQQLKKAKRETNQQKDLLKNVNHPKNPAFLKLDAEKQQSNKIIAKTQKQGNSLYFTPTTDKNKLNNSPVALSKSFDNNNKYTPKISATTIQVKGGRKNRGIQEFETIKKLGQGKFGVVSLARHKPTNGLFAIKKISKSIIQQNLMTDQLALEIRIQICCKNPNILQLYGFFSDSNSLYLVLEYMENGTLYDRLKKEKFTQRQTAIVIKQVTQALQYLHDMGIAHRDLKPQNVVSSNGVYKLCDFGWAAVCDTRRKTYCGTCDYVAPQIIEGVQYDNTVDMWCLGVLAFELLTGKAPFYHISRKETMKKILNVDHHLLEFPLQISPKARDFIEKLIRKDPNQRITATVALHHPFLQIEEDEV